MAIPADVRKMALDAVAHSETAEQIRAYGYKDVSVAEFSGPPDMSRNYEPINDEVRKQAMDAVSNKETTAQIKLVVDNESFSPGPTPSPQSAAMAGQTHLNSSIPEQM